VVTADDLEGVGLSEDQLRRLATIGDDDPQ
jgi:hypothetical protein